MLPIAGQTAGPIGLAGGVIGFKKIKKKNFLKFFKILFFNIFFSNFFPRATPGPSAVYIKNLFICIQKDNIIF